MSHLVRVRVTPRSKPIYFPDGPRRMPGLGAYGMPSGAPVISRASGSGNAAAEARDTSLWEDLKALVGSGGSSYFSSQKARADADAAAAQARLASVNARLANKSQGMQTRTMLIAGGLVVAAIVGVALIARKK